MITMATRCVLSEGHDHDPIHPEWWHHGKGLAAFPYQRIDWMPGDRRERFTDREDEYAWEEPST